MAQDPTNLDFTDAIARRAFRALLHTAGPLPAKSLAEGSGWDELQITEALTSLAHAGRVELDDQQRLLGVYGLTLKPTVHHLELRGKRFFVWCAFDSVGIPAALAESAAVTSVCALCGLELNLTIEAGKPPDLPLVISWLPKQCDSIREQFCPTINFYCNLHHFRASPVGGQSPDAYHTLEAAAAIGRDNWGWAAE